MKDRILIIEDSKSLAQLIAAKLKTDFHIDSDLAYSYQQAKRLLEKPSAQYLLSLVDLNLPESETGAGLELTHTYSIPAIVFTAHFETELREEYKKKQLIDYVYKASTDSVRYVCWLTYRFQQNRYLTVLIVDDSPSALAALAALTKNQGFRVITASSGQECMEKLPDEPDIIIIDQFLPDIMGYELCRNICCSELKKIIQIIGVSSKSDPNQAALFLKNGGHDFVERPFNPEEFTYRLNQRADYIDNIRRLDKLNEEKNNLLGMTVHDLRTPAGAIMHAVERLQSDNTAQERKAKYLNIIDRSVQSLMVLLNDLMDLSVIEAGKLNLDLKTINLCELANQCVGQAENRTQKKQTLITATLPDSAMLEADPVRISQVINNLLSNALKYSPVESCIELRVEKSTESIQVTVEDQGPGIDEADIPKLFQSFSRLGHTPTGNESSHGLGLSICRKIVESHGGTIGYKPGKKGSCFSFELPR